MSSLKMARRREGEIPMIRRERERARERRRTTEGAKYVRTLNRDRTHIRRKNKMLLRENDIGMAYE